DFFVRCKRQHPTGVFVFEIQRINQIACLVGISPHHFGRFFFTPFTLFIGHVFGRPCTPTCTVTREPHNHLANSFISCSLAIRCLTTCIASAPPLCVFTHRAIMFMLALMRLSIAALSRSSLRLRILTLPKWSLTTSDMVMLADSAKSCRACHSASENRTRSMLFRVVMIPILQGCTVLNKATPCCYTSFRTCGLVIGAYSPLRPPLGGTSRPLSSGCGAGVATLLNPTPSRERGSLQRHQVLSRHKPLRFASLFIPRSLDPFSVQHLLLA